MTILDVKNLKKGFGGTSVLKDISFSMDEGQVVSIIGSSGSGKTTLLRCLNFLEMPDSGVIRVKDETLTALLARKDCLTVQLAAYRDLADAASQNTRRARGAEIRILPAVDVRAIQKKADGLDRALRETDNALQAANWTSDLIEE